jgi:polar amino acid transport system permease protein
MSSTFEFFWVNSDLFLKGFIMTLRICLISSFLGLFIGTFTALSKLSSHFFLRAPANLFIELFRGTPLLVQIMFMSYAYPMMIRDFFSIQPELGTWSNPTVLWDMIIVLSLNTGAYQAEIIRAGIQGIPPGQMEAARGVGLSYPQSMRYVILPQAFRMISPPLAGEFINLILNSSLVSVVSLGDITFWGRSISSTSFRTLEVWLIVGMLYFVLTFSLSSLMRHLEVKYEIPGLGQKRRRRM